MDGPKYAYAICAVSDILFNEGRENIFAFLDSCFKTFNIIALTRLRTKIIIV